MKPLHVAAAIALLMAVAASADPIPPGGVGQNVEVTDPKDPKVVKEIEGPANTATDQMEIADGKMITALAKISPGWGGDPKKPFDEGVLIWDLKDPLNPQ